MSGNTSCIKLKFLHSFDRKDAQLPIKFFFMEQPEIISSSALSASESSSASSEAARPSSAFIPFSWKEKRKNQNKALLKIAISLSGRQSHLWCIH